MIIANRKFTRLINGSPAGKRNAAGFSLVEMMVVVTLFSIVSVCIFSSLSTGLKVYKKAVLFGLSNRNRLSLERFSLDLRRACRDKDIGFYGASDSVTFADVYDDRIWSVTYEYLPGKSAVLRSVAAKRSLDGPIKSGTGRKVFLAVKNFSLSYYGCCKCSMHCGFFPEWDYKLSGVPLAVQVQIELKNGSKIGKIIPVPISKR